MRGPGGTQARLLVGPTIRAFRWSPFLAAVPLGALVMVAGRAADTPAPMANLPAMALLLAASTGFVLDDPAEHTIASTPTPLLVSRALRIAVALPLALACWAAAVAYAGLGRVSVYLTLGFVAQCTVALGIAATATLVVGRSRAGLVSAFGLVLVFVVVPVAFDVSLALPPTSETWGHLYGRWLFVGALGVAAIALASSGPATRGALPLGRRMLARPSRVRAG